ncbi:hypothetical protein D3C76_1352990 [compost metagenome]
MATPMPGWAMKKFTAQAGLVALSTSGCCQMPYRPSAPRARNHTTITGPNSLPMRAVPCFWMRNRATSTISASGTTQWPMPSKAMSRPSIAESTEIAGVIMLSP